MSALTEAMQEYAEAIRGDWSDFDGRSERRVIEGWIREIKSPDPTHDLMWWRNELGICLDGNMHWYGRWGHCDVKTCPTFAAEELERVTAAMQERGNKEPA